MKYQKSVYCQQNHDKVINGTANADVKQRMIFATNNDTEDSNIR